MCEYCGCQSIRSIDELTREHPEHVAVLAVLREHIAKEQDGLFPAALTSLGSDDWAAVERVRARVGTALQDSPVPLAVAGQG